jgi:hypothetical protein
MTGITCYDSILNDQFMAGAAAYAAYVDGSIGNQPNYGYIVEAFPQAHHLSIALFADHDADALDVESGAAEPSDIPGWYSRQKARGIARPCIYANASTMEDSVLQALSGACIGLASVRLWTAHYTGEAHICGPGAGTCGQLSVPADGTQWTSAAQGRVLDQSLLLEDFFAVPAPPEPPADWVFGPVRDLGVENAGPHSVSLTFASPAVPMPLGVGHYELTVRSGGKDIASYPRVEAHESNPQSWEGGSLTPGTAYEALVRAVATDGGHASPWATVSFTTPAV